MLAQLPGDVVRHLPHLAPARDLAGLRQTCSALRDALPPLEAAGSDEVGRKVAAFVIASECGWRGVASYVHRSNLYRLAPHERARLERFSLLCGMRDAGRAYQDVRGMFEPREWEQLVHDFVTFVLRTIDYHLWARLGRRTDAAACATALRILWMVDF